jgi:outer membrane protein
MALPLVLGWAGAAAAQVPSLSLPEALEYARQHQPSLRAAQARAQAALAEALIPRAQWYPHLGATAQLYEGTTNNSTAMTLNGLGVDVPRIGGTPQGTALWSPYASSFVGIGLRQELFDFGKIAAQSAVADANASAAQSRAQVDALDLALAVKESFFAVLAAKALLSTAEAAYQRVQKERDDAAARVKSEMLGRIALTRPEADLMRFDAARIRARGSLAAAQAVLAAITGSPAPLLDAQGPAPQPTAPPDLQSALEKAASEDPEIHQYAARLRAQQERSRATLMELLPDLGLTSTLSARAGGTPAAGTTDLPFGAGFLPTVPNWDVGVFLSWSFFDEGVLARRKASLQYEAAAAADLDAVKLKASASIRATYAALEVAFQAMPALRRAVDAAKANHEQAAARFGAGMGTSVELADADALLTDAEIQLALGQFEWDRGRARLARAIAEP